MFTKSTAKIIFNTKIGHFFAKNVQRLFLFFVALALAPTVLSSCERPVLPLEFRSLVQISVFCEEEEFPKNVYIPCNATGIYSDGSQESITQVVTWVGDNSILATGAGDNAGWVKASASGSTVLEAVLGNIHGTLPLTITTATVTGCAVTPAASAYYVGATAQYSNICVFSDSSFLNVTSSSAWSSSSPATAIVSTDINSRGYVSATNEGTANIMALFDGVQGTTMLTVLDKQLLFIGVGPKVATVVEGLGIPFTATGVYSDFSTVDLTPLTTWSLTDGSVASISNLSGTAGSLTGVQAGTTKVVANFGGFSDSADVTVIAPTLNSITVTPVNPSIVKGLTQTLVAMGHYSDGSDVDISQFVTWASTDGTVASVDNSPGTNGVTTAIDTGTSTLSATLGVIMGQTTVTVTAAELASIEVTPNNSTISVSDTEQLKAIGTYTDSSTLDITSSVTWFTTDGTVASVSNGLGTEGLATAISSGTANIVATLGSISGQTNITVTPATLLSITVTPANPTISLNGSKQLLATGNYSDGSSLDITSSVTWTTGDATVVTVNNSLNNWGLATGISTGSATISATFGSVTGQTTVTVILPVLVSITVTPNNSTIKLLAMKQYTATGNYADGSTADLTTSVTWVSSNITAATISNNVGSQGRAMGLLLGSTTITATLGAISGATILTVTLF